MHSFAEMELRNVEVDLRYPQREGKVLLQKSISSTPKSQPSVLK